MSPVCKLADHVANLFDYRGLNAFGRFIEDQQLRTGRQARPIASCCCCPPRRDRLRVDASSLYRKALDFLRDMFCFAG